MLESVTQEFSPDPQLSKLMDTFRLAVNECIRIGLKENKTSMIGLSKVSYPSLKRFDIGSAYKLNAISRAHGILCSYRKLLKKGKRVRTPYCYRPVLITCYGLKLVHGFLSMPNKIQVRLNGYVLKRLQGTEIRSVTISTRTVSVCYAKDVAEIECTGTLGIDTNLENVTIAAPFKRPMQFDMSELPLIKHRYREIISNFKRNDVRIQTQIYNKYGKLQQDKSKTEIHKISARIVKYAKNRKLGIALENIKGIRKLYRKGNGQGDNYRFRLNSWAFREFQSQIEYKAKSEGLPVYYVNARGTSAKCSKCSVTMYAEENRKLLCPNCRLYIDRDENAAINIMNRGLEKLFSMWFSPYGLPDKAMKGNPMKKLSIEVIPVADGSKSKSHPTKT